MDKGAHFHNCDFQVHTPRDIKWVGRKPTNPTDRAAHADNFVMACRERKINAVAITDHHDFVFFPFIKEAAEREIDATGRPFSPETRLIVFPGIEMTFTDPASCQAILILDADYPVDELVRILSILAIFPAPVNAESTCPVVPISQDVIRGLDDLHKKLDSVPGLEGRYIVLPNVSRGHGGILRRGFYEHYRKMPCVGGYLDGDIPTETGYLNIVNGLDANYGSKKIALIQTSDNRNEAFNLLGQHTTWIKWVKPTAEALRQACLASESRICQTAPSMPQISIRSIDVTNSKFLGAFNLSFNQQYNGIIGGRGTGKSTILEYLRWGLCDQTAESDDPEESGTILLRREKMIKNTLRNFQGEVRVTVDVNGVTHIVKRNSATNAILLKIADNDFQSVGEEDVQRLLPVQAYSQKQLSDVGVSPDELKRFVERPITSVISEIDAQIASTAKLLTASYSDLIRMKDIQHEIENVTLESRSLDTQAAQLRTSLVGLSEDDQKIISSKATSDWEVNFVSQVQDDIGHVHTEVTDLLERITSMSAVDLAEVMPINGELVKTMAFERAKLLADVRKALEQALACFNPQNRATLSVAIASWEKCQAEFVSRYNSVTEKAQSSQQLLAELQKIEKRQREIAEIINNRTRAIRDIDRPDIRFSEARASWLNLHRRKLIVLKTESEKFTALSRGYIRAEMGRGVDFTEIRKMLKHLLEGTRIRDDRIQAIESHVSSAVDPIQSWEQLLLEIGLLAETRESDDDSMVLPPTPTLASLEYSEEHRKKMVRKLSPDNWIALATVRMDFVPDFQYATNNEMGDVMPFREASAGQQATALLAVLLNQDGMPLIIDQPEDDIDNRAINDIISSIWGAKAKRQLIFSSHNANLVVNGDAELVVCCDYRDSTNQTHGQIKLEGAIDSSEVRKEITNVMEGGERAFVLRKDKYGF